MLISYIYEQSSSLMEVIGTVLPEDSIACVWSDGTYSSSTNMASGWVPDLGLEQGSGIAILLPGEESGLSSGEMSSLFLNGMVPANEAAITINSDLNLISYPYAAGFNLSASSLDTLGTGSSELESADKIYVRVLVSGGEGGYQYQYKYYALYDGSSINDPVTEWRDADEFSIPVGQDIIIPLGQGFWYVNKGGSFERTPVNPN